MFPNNLRKTIIKSQKRDYQGRYRGEGFESQTGGRREGVRVCPGRHGGGPGHGEHRLLCHKEAWHDGCRGPGHNRHSHVHCQRETRQGMRYKALNIGGAP